MYRIFISFVLITLWACNAQQPKKKDMNIPNRSQNTTDSLQIATLGGGCFWCIEAIYDQLQGVEKVVSGYAGGKVKNPTYKEVCSGLTGHAEVVQIHFDPNVISYDELLDIFWYVHDPTTLNRQGADVGTQYRSIILYHDDNQKERAENSMKTSADSDLWNGEYTTQIAPITEFYSAENYHQDYYENNKDQPYCSAVIAPKIKKFYQKYKDKIKPEYQ